MIYEYKERKFFVKRQSFLPETQDVTNFLYFCPKNKK